MLRIREIRKSRGLTQAELGKLAGVSRSYLSEMETGSKDINATRLTRIAQALGVSVVDLFEADSSDPILSLLLARFPAMTEAQKLALLAHAESYTTEDDS